MNWLKMASGMAARPMDEAAAPTGENGGGAANAPENAPESGAADDGKDSGSLLGGDDSGKTPTDGDGAPADAKKADDAAKGDGNPAPKKAENLLDDDAADDAAKDKGGEKPTEGAATPTAEQVAEWAKGVNALDMGDGVTWSDDLLREMAPSLMTLDKAAQEKTIKAYADFQARQAKALAENADLANRSRIKLCQERFGGDLRKFTGLAKTAGAKIFEKHPEIWNALKSTPEFANNPDVIECLAEVGRLFATDTGHVAPKEGAGDGEVGDVLHRMYKDVRP